MKRRRKKDIQYRFVDFKEARKRNIPPVIHAFESGDPEILGEKKEPQDIA